MVASIWSDFTEWAEDTYEDTKEWAHSVFGQLKGSETSSSESTGGLASATSALSSDTGFASLKESPMTPSTSILAISSPEASILATAATQPVPTAIMTETPTLQTATATPSSSSSPLLRENLHMVLIWFSVGFAVATFLYLCAPIVFRFGQFVGNVTRLYFHPKSSGSFSRDSEAGLSSEAFSLTQNIDGGDQRNGLDKKVKLRVLWYMFFYGETFDEARLRLVRYQFAKNGIGPDGQPLDPKYIRRE